VRYPELTTRFVAGVAVAAAVCLAAPAASVASGYGCDASAVRLTVLGRSLEPVTANRGAASCASDSKTLTNTSLGALAAPLGLAALPVKADAIAASTQVSGTGVSQKALAVGGLANLSVPLATLPSLLSLPQVKLPDSIKSVPVDLSAVKSLLQGSLPLGPLDPLAPVVNSMPTSANVDLTQALQGLLPSGKLPVGDLLDIGGAVAYAGGVCQNGQPAVSGTSQVLGVKILGQDVPIGQPVDRTLSLIDSANIDPSKADLNKIDLGLPAPVKTLIDSLPAANTLLTSSVQSALDGLASIPVLDPTVAQVKITPGATTTKGDKVIQQALNVSVTVLGQKILEGVLGEASASKGDVVCNVARTAASSQLQCTKRRLVLTDVVERNGRVKLIGVADQRLAGKTVDIVFEHTGEVVGHAKVARDGGFTTAAPLPDANVRDTNLARYIAKLGRERSLDLKLRRRMIVDSMTSKGGKVTISGRVVRPLGSPVRTITLTRRVSCNHTEVVKRFTPDRDGTFRVTVPNPKNANGAAVYRLGTQVRKTTSNPKLFPTFTLPRAVELG
jgi:hypothetical protein